MRDPNRIKPYCDTLATIWGIVPDWRLGQLMINAIYAYTNEHGNIYIEDEDFLMYLYDFVNRALAQSVSAQT